jgi:hypothetical protein
MTKIIEKKTKSIVQLHKDAFDLIEKHLPSRYVDDVRRKVGYTVSAGTIRNIKNKCNPVTNKSLKIVNALVELALDNKKETEKLESLIK